MRPMVKKPHSTHRSSEGSKLLDAALVMLWLGTPLPGMTPVAMAENPLEEEIVVERWSSVSGMMREIGEFGV
jgi:hypothetical protein